MSEHNLPVSRRAGSIASERVRRYAQLQADPAFVDHERRAKRVLATVDLKGRFIALTAYYGCARREIESRPFDWGVDPRAVCWQQFMTPNELAMWEALQASGTKFYPHYPIGRFFADFANPGAKVVIDCDGVSYQRDWADDERDRQMAARGWTVLRISSRDCLHERPDTEDDPSPLWIFVRRVSALVAERKRSADAI